MMLEVRQVRSSVKRPKRQQETLKGLGLRRIGSEVKLKDSPNVRGMIAKVTHLIEWTEVKG